MLHWPLHRVHAVDDTADANQGLFPLRWSRRISFGSAEEDRIISERFWLIDAQWPAIEPLLPKLGGKPRVDDRR